MKKILRYILMICLGILLSIGYLKVADVFFMFMTSDGISFSDWGVQTLIIIIVYMVIIFPGILILLKAISKRWQIK